MIEIIRVADRLDLNWRFHLTSESDKDNCGCIQDQVIAIVWGLA